MVDMLVPEQYLHEEQLIAAPRFAICSDERASCMLTWHVAHASRLETRTPCSHGALLDMLERDGHFVEAGHGGQRGIDTFRAAGARSEPFAVVVTDLGMPYVDGRAVAQAVKADDPLTSVVLLTGWGHRILAD